MTDEIAAERAGLDLEHADALLEVLIAQIEKGTPAQHLVPLAHAIRQRTQKAQAGIDALAARRENRKAA